MNEYVKGTMNMFQQAQGQITGSTAHLQAISGDMKVATEVFHKSQQEYNDKISQLQKNTEDSIDTVSELLKDSRTNVKRLCRKVRDYKARSGFHLPATTKWINRIQQNSTVNYAEVS